MVFTEELASIEVQLWGQETASVVFAPVTNQLPGAKLTLGKALPPSIYPLPTVETESRAGLISENHSLEHFPYLHLSSPKVTSSSLKTFNTSPHIPIFSFTSFKLQFHYLHLPPYRSYLDI